MVRIAFAIEGISNLKVLGPLIRESNRFNIEPVAVIAKGSGGKPYDEITPEKLIENFPSIASGNIVQYNESSLVKDIAELKVRALLTLNAYRKYSPHVKPLKEAGIKMYGLDYFANSVYAAATPDFVGGIDTCLPNITGRLVMSEYFKDLELALRPKSKKYESKFFGLGASVADVYNYVSASDIEHYFPSLGDKKIICLLAPNIRKQHLHQLYGFWAKWKFRRLFKAIQKYCIDNDYVFVIKNRAKQWRTGLYENLSTLYVDDLPQLVYPYTSAVLLSRCAALIHFGSMAVLEAAANNVPSLGIEVSAVDKLHTYMDTHSRNLIFDEFFSNKADGLFSFSAVSHNMPLDVEDGDIERELDNLINNQQDNRRRFDAFQTKFLGLNDNERPTERILSHISQAL